MQDSPVDPATFYDFVWNRVQERRDRIETAQDARNVCEDEAILTRHGGPDPDCPTCERLRPERPCHVCQHTPANRCEWVRSVGRRHMTGTEGVCAAPNSECACHLPAGHQGDHRCDHGPYNESPS